jgi:hypothetical protein
LLLLGAGCGSGREEERRTEWTAIATSDGNYDNVLASTSIYLGTSFIPGPFRLALKVETDPSIDTRTTWTIDCQVAKDAGGPARATTPVFREIEVPDGAEANGCLVRAHATKPKGRDLTLSILMDPPPAVTP